MKFELTQRFYFEAAHTLQRAHGDTEASRRIHGHTYHAAVTVGGMPDAASGMVVDLALLRAAIDTLRATLDHRLLDDIPEIGPGRATLETLCRYIHGQLQADWPLAWVEVSRPASGDSCVLKSEH